MDLGNGWLGALISGLFGTVQQGSQMAFDASQAKKNREFQSDEAELNRIFQSDEAALQREWSSAEAERARDWNEEMYAKYNSLSGKIAQAEDAGVNPMFAVTGQAVSPMTANSSAPSGASAGSVGTPSGSSASMAFVDIIGKILGFKQLQSEMDVNEALAEKYRQEATGQSISNETLKEWNVSQILEARSRIEYNTENTALVTSKILNTDADTEKKSAELSQIGASIANMNADTDVKVKQLAVMTSEIIKNNKSVDVMASQIDAMISEIIKNYKSVDVMDAQISGIRSEVGLNHARAKEIAQHVRNLVQEYGHRDVLNGFERAIASEKASTSSVWDSSQTNPIAGGILETLKFFRDLLSIKAN